MNIFFTFLFFFFSLSAWLQFHRLFLKYGFFFSTTILIVKLKPNQSSKRRRASSWKDNHKIRYIPNLHLRSGGLRTVRLFGAKKVLLALLVYCVVRSIRLNNFTRLPFFLTIVTLRRLIGMFNFYTGQWKKSIGVGNAICYLSNWSLAYYQPFDVFSSDFKIASGYRL